MNSKMRDWMYGVKPRNVEHKAEELPQSPAKKPYPGYCKRLKAEHVFTLHDVKMYPHRSWRNGAILIVGMTHYKEYRCDGCGKKNIIREEWTYDEPIREQGQSA